MSAAPTLVARLTPVGSSALATLAVRGPNAVRITERLFRSGEPGVLTSTARPYYGLLGSGPRDDVVLHVLQAEHVPDIEIDCHGGPAMVEALLGQFVAAGAARRDADVLLASRGLPEVEREARSALAACVAPAAAAVLLDQIDGRLAAEFERIGRLASDPESRFEATDRANRLLEWADLGLRLVDGWRVLLFGRPNVGKSRLLNRVLGFDRAIVADVAGTTRDVLTYPTALAGWQVELIDGAGLRASEDVLEVTGQAALRAAALEADLRIQVVDTSTPRTPEDAALAEEFRPHLRVGNKLDLPSAWPEEALAMLEVRLSALEGGGVERLLGAIVQRLVPHPPRSGTLMPLTRRQVAWLRSRTG